MKPLIKWAGGKRHIARVLESHLPEGWDKGTYFEPFIGGAALFLYLKPKRASLSDVNERLINFYSNVRLEAPALVKQIGKLAKIFDNADENLKLEVFLDFRNKFNEGDPSDLRTSAYFYALNKLCFNGLYRENAKGLFNVPFGKKTAFPELDAQAFEEAARIFKGAKLKVADFEDALKTAKPGDFVYLDPPYIPVDATSSFTSYSAGGFGVESQERLARVLGELASRGVNAMLSNSDTPLTRSVYKGFRFVEIKAPRMVSAKSSGRGQISELLIMNY